jgi:hypothetical protein
VSSRRLKLVCALVLGSAVASGCGGGIDIVEVTGTVQFSGAPVPKAEVCFIREAGTDKGEPAPPAIAVTGPDGTFTLKTGDRDGAVPGRYRVTVQKSNFEDLNIPNPLPKPYRKKDIAAYMIANKLVVSHLLPLEYADMNRSPLSAEVVADGTNHFDLTLVGTAPEPPRQ